MVVVIKLAAKFQIELTSELGNPLPDVAGLHLQVFVIIKSLFHHNRRLFHAISHWPIISNFRSKRKGFRHKFSAGESAPAEMERIDYCALHSSVARAST